ncbi:rho guanine nucleotide exchange factor 19-like [Hyperolius riggenbachi]|uniref:rho guanine nucleotide exchange factor 19-like n=1 Tax=Hyperolius riggenbachi TaxID=752182 RepID=UPI0035A297AB
MCKADAGETEGSLRPAHAYNWLRLAKESYETCYRAIEKAEDGGVRVIHADGAGGSPSMTSLVLYAYVILSICSYSAGCNSQYLPLPADMALLCRKRCYTDSPPVEVTVKRCASCPETSKSAVVGRRTRDHKWMLHGLFWNKKLNRHVSGGKWKSCDDVSFRALKTRQPGAPRHVDGDDLTGSQVFSNPLYQSPEHQESPKTPSIQQKEGTGSPAPPPPVSAHIQTPAAPSIQEPSLIGRLLILKDLTWEKLKESKLVHTYQDDCGMVHTKGDRSTTILPADIPHLLTDLQSVLPVSPNNACHPHYSWPLWHELPEVKAEGIAQRLSLQQRQLQEAIFEVVTSEASYQRSLSIAISHFQESPKLSECLVPSDKHTLFSNLPSVLMVSKRFLLDLEEGLEEDLFLEDIGDRVLRHCPDFHNVYIPYVTNQMYQEKLMQQLIRENGRFLQVLKKLEEQPVCNRQLLKTFLVLPFQRITRLKILLENIVKLWGSDSRLSSVVDASAAVGQIVGRCNEGVRSMMQTEELVLLEKQMDFHNTKLVPIISRGRVLVQHGELLRIVFQELGVGHRPGLASRPVYLHLFSDLLLLSSRSVTGRFLVTDCAKRGQAKADHVKAKSLGLPNLAFLLRLTENHIGGSCELVLQAPSEIKITGSRRSPIRWRRADSPGM